MDLIGAIPLDIRRNAAVDASCRRRDNTDRYSGGSQTDGITHSLAAPVFHTTKRSVNRIRLTLLSILPLVDNDLQSPDGNAICVFNPLGVYHFDGFPWADMYTLYASDAVFEPDFTKSTDAVQPGISHVYFFDTVSWTDLDTGVATGCNSPDLIMAICRGRLFLAGHAGAGFQPEVFVEVDAFFFGESLRTVDSPTSERIPAYLRRGRG